MGWSGGSRRIIASPTLGRRYKPPAEGEGSLALGTPSARSGRAEEWTLGAAIMLGTLFGLIGLIFLLVLRYDPEAHGTSSEHL